MSSMPLRDAETLMCSAVEVTLDSLDLGPGDAAAIMLARRYAALIDDGDLAVTDRVGPKLFAVLESLGATPAARAKMTGGAKPDGRSRLTALREAHHGA